MSAGSIVGRRVVAQTLSIIWHRDDLVEAIRAGRSTSPRRPPPRGGPSVWTPGSGLRSLGDDVAGAGVVAFRLGRGVNRPSLSHIFRACVVGHLRNLRRALICPRGLVAVGDEEQVGAHAVCIVGGPIPWSVGCPSWPWRARWRRRVFEERGGVHRAARPRRFGGGGTTSDVHHNPSTVPRRSGWLLGPPSTPAPRRRHDHENHEDPICCRRSIELALLVGAPTTSTFIVGAVIRYVYRARPQREGDGAPSVPRRLHPVPLPPETCMAGERGPDRRPGPPSLLLALLASWRSIRQDQSPPHRHGTDRTHAPPPCLLPIPPTPHVPALAADDDPKAPEPGRQSNPCRTP